MLTRDDTWTWNIPVPFDTDERRALLCSYLNLDIPEEQQIATFIDDPGYGYGDINDSGSLALHKLFTGQKLMALVCSKTAAAVRFSSIYSEPYRHTSKRYAGLHQNRDIVKHVAKTSFLGPRGDAIHGIIFSYPTIKIVEFLIKGMMHHYIHRETDLGGEVWLVDFQRRLFCMRTRCEETEARIGSLEQLGGKIEKKIHDGPVRDGFHITLDEELVEMCYQDSIEQLKHERFKANSLDISLQNGTLLTGSSKYLTCP